MKLIYFNELWEIIKEDNTHYFAVNDKRQKISIPKDEFIAEVVLVGKPNDD